MGNKNPKPVSAPEPKCLMCEDRGYLVYQLTGLYNKRCKCNPDYGKSCRET